jgi:hypothetical protein
MKVEQQENAGHLHLTGIVRILLSFRLKHELWANFSCDINPILQTLSLFQSELVSPKFE